MKPIYRKFGAPFLALLFMLSLSFNLSARHYQEEGDTMRYFDAWGWQLGEEGPVRVRIVHCDWPGEDCLIGPTIIGPCPPPQ